MQPPDRRQRSLRPAPSLRALALACVATAGLHCGGEAPAPDAETREPPRVTATEARAGGELPPRFPEDGLRIEQDGELFTVFARDVPRFDVLRKLAVRGRFELDDWSEQDPLLDVYVESATLETVLARVIEPTAYRLTYANDESTGRNAVRHLEVGTPPVSAAATDPKEGRKDGERADRDEARQEARRYRKASAEETAAALAARAVRQERRRLEALAESESADEQTRIDAVELGLDAADPASRDRLTELALDDPSPSVRAAAIEGLSFGAADREITRALDDPDRRVVFAALEALSWSDDPAVARAIAEKVDHADPEIAEAARRALDDLPLPR